MDKDEIVNGILLFVREKNVRIHFVIFSFKSKIWTKFFVRILPNPNFKSKFDEVRRPNCLVEPNSNSNQ